MSCWNAVRAWALDVHSKKAAALPRSGREHTRMHTHRHHVHSTHIPGWLPGSSSSLSLFLLTGELEGKPAVSQAHLLDLETGWPSTSPRQGCRRRKGNMRPSACGEEKEMQDVSWNLILLVVVVVLKSRETNKNSTQPRHIKVATLV